MKRILKMAFCLCIASIVTLLGVVGYAYFSKQEIYDGMLGGEVELLFDRLDDETLAKYQTEYLLGTADSDAEWGTEQNPYIISNIKHLYNLAELQRLGYFDIHYISKNYDENGNYVTDATTGQGKIMPYFMVCTPDGKPVTIDGNTFDGTIASIGTEKYPFIGSVKGAFVDGDCEVDGKSSDTSVIYNITVKGNPADVDAGLFGYVGFLGTLPESESASFQGQISEISDLLLYDVTVEVDSSLWDTVTSFIEDHVFSFTSLNESDAAQVPHENHHIGILAGHVSYTKIEYISVYYSSDDKVAINLTDTTTVNGISANYLSVTGIIGYLDNINPTVDENGNISSGSGTSNVNIVYSPIGGGGLESGKLAGYIVAKDMYELYHWTALGEDESGTVIIKDALDKDGNALCQEWMRDRLFGLGQEATGRYYFYDGVFTFALSGTASNPSDDVMEPTWNKDSEFWTDSLHGQFSIGPTDKSQWITNTLKGNQSVSAFVKPISSDAELIEALKTKDVFILNENGEYINLMSLYEQSTAGSGGPEEKYTVPFGQLQYANQEFLNMLFDSYSGMTQEQLDSAFAEMGLYNTPEMLKNAIENDGLIPIYVGTTSSNLTVEDIRNKYKINADTVLNTYQYFDMSNNPITPTADGVQDYYDYTGDYENPDIPTNYNGYFYYTIEKKGFIVTRTYYTYYWVDFEKGTSYEIQSSTTTTPQDYFGTTTAGMWQGEPMYTKTVTVDGNSVNATGVVVYPDGNIFYNGGTNYTSGNTAITTGGVQLAKPAGNAVGYFYQPAGTDEWYYYNGDILVGNLSYSYTTDAGRQVYKADGTNYEGIKLVRYQVYTFSNVSGINYMSMVQVSYSSVFGANYGTYNLLWNGTITGAETGSNFNHKFAVQDITPTVNSSTQNAYIRFNDDGTCYICYTIGTTTRYIKYDSANRVFKGTASMNDEGTRLKIFSVEGTQGLDYGRVTFDPAEIVTAEDVANDSTKVQNTFNIEEYVLFPNYAADGNTTEYSVIKLSALEWNNGNALDNNGILHGEDIYDAQGNLLYPSNLSKTIHLTGGIRFGLNVNIGGGSLGSSNIDDQPGFIQAPVGTYPPVKANIPQSCVAFRVNKAEGEKKIRVILAVPTSELSKDEDGYEFNDNWTHYFNLYQLPEVTGSFQFEFFTADEYVERFELPKSFPYTPGTAPADGEYITVNIGKVEETQNEDGTITREVVAGAEDYYCSLNGDKILVAYEFTVVDEGVYVLGMSAYDNDAGAYTEEGAPLELVYISADGIASSGRDGASGSQIGTIDYVYDYGNRVITVKDESNTGENGVEDYNMYYPSHIMLYFDNRATLNPFPDINDELIKIRRYIDPDVTENIKSTVSYNITSNTQAALDNKYVKIARYLPRYADIVKEREQATP